MISEKLLSDVYKALEQKQNITKLITGTRQKTGRIINGKEEYCDILNIGNCPNNDALMIDYKTDDKTIIDYYLIGISSSNEIIKAPNSSADRLFFNIFFTSNKISCNSNQDRSRFTGYVYIYFTYL